MTIKELSAINAMLEAQVQQERAVYDKARSKWIKEHSDWDDLPDDLKTIRLQLQEHKNALDAFQSHEWN